MSFRRRLLLLFALTVLLSVAAVTTIISTWTRRAFDHANDERCERGEGQTLCAPRSV